MFRGSWNGFSINWFWPRKTLRVMRDVINCFDVLHPVGARTKRQREPGARGFRYGASWGQHERQNGSVVHFSVGVLVPVSK